MNEEEKKAVCELKNYITKRNRSYTKLDRHDKAINNLLNLISNLQKENTEFEKLSKDCSYSVDIVRENTKLRRQVFDLELENTKLKKQNQCYINSIQAIIPVLTQDYVPKQEIKDKIKELKEIKQEKYERVQVFDDTTNACCYQIVKKYDYEIAQFAIKTLQNLLERSREDETYS